MKLKLIGKKNGFYNDDGTLNHPKIANHMETSDMII